MKQIEVGIISDTPNAAVVQLPGRRFPGIVLQGDSLSILSAAASRARAAIASGQAEAATDELSELSELLDAYKRAYEVAMQSAGLELPYVTQRT